MTADHFRLEGGKFADDTHTIENIEDFRKTVRPVIGYDKDNNPVVRPVKVIARATPHDKLVLTKGLSDEHKIVAVTGEGFADVEALKAAAVGFSMGSGCPAAKSASSMILINDNIASIINAVLWGRNIYCNVRRFLQF
jgi:Ca2+-transporting ATPase